MDKEVASQMNGKSRVVLITGATSGFGLECARLLRQQGYRVYGTTTDPAETTGRNPYGEFQLIHMNVHDDELVNAGVMAVIGRADRIDIVLNNAGFGVVGAIEDTSSAEAHAQLEPNFFGVHRVCRAVLPHMRAQRYGYIVNMSSLGGEVGLPFQGLYSAAKFAIEGYSEALRIEVKPFGIRVAMIEPADFNTGFVKNRTLVAAANASSPYDTRFRAAIGKSDRDTASNTSVDTVAHAFLRIIEQGHPKLRHAVGPFLPCFAVSIKRFGPAWLFERLMTAYYS